MPAPLINAAITLAELAPTITRWFTGDREKVGSAQKVADQLVGIAKRITGEPDVVSAIKLLEKDPALLLRYQQEVLNVDRDLEMCYLNDRQDARARDMAFVNAGRYNVRADLMVIAAALGLIGCLVSLAFFKGTLPGEAVGIISTIAGIFGSCLKDAYSFEFGSSRGSKAKDAAVLMSSGKSYS
jgi:hypothetical protein